ncbi:MAG TPA: hypothetical protein DD381_13300 [Lentisphaeria bacterium]|nr:MAG: hypothetical protein A2X47_11775 [Lentisphaerae bacterium GWF2_38_69]HBM17298.1 hypothetical protein [Lentisphaeria bacterium]
MKKYPNREIIEDISLELGAAPAFIEKDWYAVEILKIISSIIDIPIIFTGGTSLSKAYGLIKRFSEDLDFRILDYNLSREERKNHRFAIIERIRNMDNISIDEKSIESKNKSSFFSFNINYHQYFELPYALRPYLKLEFSFDERELLTELKQIQSFITLYTSKDQYDCQIKTILPLETASDKFCALLWRIDIKNRDLEIGCKENDPTIIRHLHDLSALTSIVLTNKLQFKDLVDVIYRKDKSRGRSNRSGNIRDLAQRTLQNLSEDKLYENEYKSFVDGMSYAPEREKITFQDGLKSLELIVEIL